MRSEWVRTTTRELIDAGVLQVGDGYRAKNSELGDAGLPFVRAANINGDIDINSCELLLPASVAKAGDKKSQPGDTVFTSKGTVGRFAFVRAAAQQFVYSPQLCYWRSVNAATLDPRFLHFWLRGPEAWSQFSYLKGQTDMADYVSLADQRSMVITLPSADEQRRIAGVLAALDDKIEHSSLLIGLIRHIIRAEAGQLLADADDDERCLTDVADFVNGGAFTKLANGVGRPILRIKELNDGVTPNTPRTDAIVSDDQIARHNDLLFSWSASLDVYRWFGDESLINQHIFKVTPKEGQPLWLLEAWIRLHLPSFRVIASDKAVTMGHIRRADLYEAMVPVPDGAAVSEVRQRLDALDDLCGVLARERASLSPIRDGLLPKLISGQLRVHDSYDPDDVLGTLGEKATASA